MHDPQTLAHEIKYPWFHHQPWPKQFRKDPNPFELRHQWKQMTPEQQKDCEPSWPEGYRNTFISVWHVDPERDGSDDSCGYSYIRLTKKQIEILRNAAWHEGHHPHFLCCAAKEFTGSLADAQSLHIGMILLVCRVLRIKMTFAEVQWQAMESVHIRDIGKYGSAFCFLPGYHTNNPKDSESSRQDHFHGILCGVARNILTSQRSQRPWWKHPKWHFWHWKIQCHPLDSFKRWAFSRCCKCGGRFTWGYAPTTNSWNSEGPKWFRGEKDVYHSDCNQPASHCLAEAQLKRN